MKNASKLIQTIKGRTNAFTIIELLVVIGIISILAVALLISLNPAEAQKRARDANRLKDINTLQAILEQYLNDGNAPICTSALCRSTLVGGSASTVVSQLCATNWLGVNLCNYAKTIPADPANGQTRTCNGPTSGTPVTCLMRYRLYMIGSNYEIGTMLESQSNYAKAANDGGTHPEWLQIFSNTELPMAAYVQNTDT